jgi:AcrR family transcriptional regulator
VEVRKRSFERTERSQLPDHTDPRVTRTVQACGQAVVELASQRPVSRITVAELAGRAGVTRATFYNHYGSPLELLLQVLMNDLERAHRLEEERRAEGSYTSAQMLRLTIVDVADHIERFKALYQLALRDAADTVVYAALVRHFTDYALSFIARSDNPDLPEANRQVVAEFVANGFAGAIKAWLGDDAVTKEDLVDAAFACAPAWWS